MSQEDGQPSHLRFSGAVAVGHGFDTVKTRMQCAPKGTYHGALDVLLKIIKNEGMFALYKGATPPAVGWAAIDSVLLGSLHNYRLFLLRSGMTEMSPSGLPRLTLFAHGLAGLFAGWTSAIVATPVELLKVKLQLQSQKSPLDRRFKGPIHCARQIICIQGITGLWSGFTGSLAFRSNFFWMFLSFEAIMRAFSRLEGTPYQISTGSANFWSGGLASFVYWAMAIPLDNIKNRMMAHPYPQPYPQTVTSAQGVLKNPSFLRVARHIYYRDGMAGFFRGLTPCFLRAFPVNASALFVYEVP
ncbi:mitochondrial carrier domain-containing protein [Gymnopilus junonius]|uniref:Mitochondrial carrier domain-containing protein n=1 Tax=Gymnopilus junonius TaxID=109634 RepID=A0A9P5NQH1_GYMJU|nr:mitochondrial carrier domain-containing protein [Gymnopilus junonius]